MVSTSYPAEATQEDMNTFVAEVRSGAGVASRGRLIRALGWNDYRYNLVKDALVSQGIIAVQGAKVQITEKNDPVPVTEVEPEQVAETVNPVSDNDEPPVADVTPPVDATRENRPPDFTTIRFPLALDDKWVVTYDGLQWMVSRVVDAEKKTFAAKKFVTMRSSLFRSIRSLDIVLTDEVTETLNRLPEKFTDFASAVSARSNRGRKAVAEPAEEHEHL